MLFKLTSLLDDVDVAEKGSQLECRVLSSRKNSSIVTSSLSSASAQFAERVEYLIIAHSVQPLD